MFSMPASKTVFCHTPGKLQRLSF
ncbi:hypothetical protein FWK35_00006823 [Aphis craccivora]|uniref:Uncharacterized protein n=1 Tax=Aphis craccivora TaxID=307492 RepID=A0A6G0ZJT9_APHCR|nr:hypothetical protein FWK35_00006823 [Aphis craccivora]